MARNEVPVEKRFPVLVQISRASHFAWRQAVVATCPGCDPVAVVNKMWELTGHDTAAAYVKRLDPQKPLPLQFAKAIEWSSQCMGEDAEALPGQTDDEAFLTRALALMEPGPSGPKNPVAVALGSMTSENKKRTAPENGRQPVREGSAPRGRPRKPPTIDN